MQLCACTSVPRLHMRAHPTPTQSLELTQVATWGSWCGIPSRKLAWDSQLIWCFPAAPCPFSSWSPGAFPTLVAVGSSEISSAGILGVAAPAWCPSACCPSVPKLFLVFVMNHFSPTRGLDLSHTEHVFRRPWQTFHVGVSCSSLSDPFQLIVQFLTIITVKAQLTEQVT